jgi:hypothetical protein
MVFAQKRFGPISRTLNIKSSVSWTKGEEEGGSGKKGGPAASGAQVQVEAHWHELLRGEGVDMASMVDSIGSPAPARRASTYGEVVDARRCVALSPTRPFGRPSGAWCGFPRAALCPANMPRTRRKTRLG